MPEFIREKEGKANAFIDKRFGEDDKNLSLEDKMLLRFKKEKQVYQSRISHSLHIFIEDSHQIQRNRRIYDLGEEQDFDALGLSLSDRPRFIGRF